MAQLELSYQHLARNGNGKDNGQRIGNSGYVGGEERKLNF